MDDLQALRQAYFHYESEVKAKKNYAIPIRDGLLIAIKKIEKYNELFEILKISERGNN